jgi:hypothetical protein
MQLNRQENRTTENKIIYSIPYTGYVHIQATHIPTLTPLIRSQREQRKENFHFSDYSNGTVIKNFKHVRHAT